MLQAIARTTAADYFCAATGAELAQVFEDLQSRLGLQKVELEVTALFTLVAAALGALGAGLSLGWHGPHLVTRGPEPTEARLGMGIARCLLLPSIRTLDGVSRSQP